MNSTNMSDDHEIAWKQLAPHLDQAVAALSEADRSAILLRFYESKPLREVGLQLGVTEEAAKKRVSRAVEKMRGFLTRRGVVLTAGGAGLVVLLTGKTVQAAPPTLAASVVMASLASASGSAVLPQLAHPTLNAWRWAKLKLAAGIAAASVTSIIVVVNTMHSRQQNATPAQTDATVGEVMPQATVVAATNASTPSLSPAEGAAKLRAMYASVTNVLVRYEARVDQDMQTYEKLKQESGGFGQIVGTLPKLLECVWAKQGTNEYLERNSPAGDVVQFRERFWFDGKRTIASFTQYHHESIVIHADRVTELRDERCYGAISCLDPDGNTYDAILAAPSVAELPSQDSHLKRFRVPRPNGMDRVFEMTLDESNGFTLREFRVFVSGKPWEEWTVNGFATVQGSVWLPTKATLTAYLAPSGDRLATYHISVTELHVNEPLPRDVLEPQVNHWALHAAEMEAAQSAAARDAAAAAARARPPPTNGMWMDLNGFPANAFCAVLAGSCPKRLLVDPHFLFGTVTYHGENTATFEEHLPGLNVALGSNGWRLVDTGDSLRIIRTNSAPTAATTPHMELIVQHDKVVWNGKAWTVAELCEALGDRENEDVEVWISDPDRSSEIKFSELAACLQKAHLHRVFYSWLPH